MAHLQRKAKIFFGITFWRSLETRLNSVAKPTEFVPRPLLACVTFFATSLCRHIGVYKKHRRVVNTNSNFHSSKVKNVLRPKVSKYFSVFNLNLVFCFVILQRTVNCQINNSKNLQLKLNSLLITLYFLDLISQLAITPEIICFCDIKYITC